MTYEEEREELIEKMRRKGTLESEEVEEAVRSAPRHLFVPEGHRDKAYRDAPLPIGEDQTISQPSTVAMMTEALDVREGDRVLEIGAGSGWQAALLGYLVGEEGEVVTIERFEDLAETAKENLEAAGIENVDVRIGDGTLDVPGEEFDRIIVTAAAPGVPEPLAENLTDGGRLVIPVGRGTQEMRVYEKNGEMEVIDRLGRFRFVPLVGEHGFDG